MIEVSNLTKKYNNVVVLDNISFSVTDTWRTGKKIGLLATLIWMCVGGKTLIKHLFDNIHLYLEDLFLIFADFIIVAFFIYSISVTPSILLLFLLLISLFNLLKKISKLKLKLREI